MSVQTLGLAEGFTIPEDEPPYFTGKIVIFDDRQRSEATKRSC